MKRRATEDEANQWFRDHADKALVDAFWAGKKPAGWPAALPFPLNRTADVIPIRRRSGPP